MFPSQPRLTGKRKADDRNPLNALTKRAKQIDPNPFNAATKRARTNDDSQVEQDVRAMEDETAHLRRNSRAHTTIESPLLSTNPALQFGSCGESSNTSRSREKMRVTDMSTPLPENETPKLKRNKELRKSSSGRGKRISSSFEATGILCVFTFRSTEVC